MMEAVRDFLREEDGAALAEYIVLLGLMIAGAIVSVVAFGSEISGIYRDWANWAGQMPSGGAT